MTEQHQDVQAELNDQLLVRREKMAQMAEAGVNPLQRALAGIIYLPKSCTNTVRLTKKP